MKKALNIALLISFIVSSLAPLTGVAIHKMASTLFLLLSIIHTITNRRKLGAKRWFLLIAIVLSFVAGLLGLLFEQFPVILMFHNALSIALVFFLAMHIYIFHKKLR